MADQLTGQPAMPVLTPEMAQAMMQMLQTMVGQQPAAPQPAAVQAPTPAPPATEIRCKLCLMPFATQEELDEHMADHMTRGLVIRFSTWDATTKQMTLADAKDPETVKWIGWWTAAEVGRAIKMLQEAFGLHISEVKRQCDANRKL